MKKIVYFDNASTTMMNKCAAKEMIKWFDCGNPSNKIHKMGMDASEKIYESRCTISNILNVYPNEIYFTSGATESNNLILQGIVNYYLENYKYNFTIITSSFEHLSVLNIFKYFEKNNRIQVLYVNPCTDKNNEDYGSITLDNIKKCMQNAKYVVILLSIIHINNEIGTIQDINQIGKFARDNNIFFHTDVTQSIGKIKLNLKYIDSISFSGHKFHGPKGIGGLYINGNYKFYNNLFHGGAQEFNKRSGTENVPGIVGMTVALSDCYANLSEKQRYMKKLKKYLIYQLKMNFLVDIIGQESNFYSSVISVIFKQIYCSLKLLEILNEYGIYVSKSSACTMNKNKFNSSHVFDSMNIDADQQKKAIRISLCNDNTIAECNYLIKILKYAIY